MEISRNNFDHQQMKAKLHKPERIYHNQRQSGRFNQRTARPGFVTLTPLADLGKRVLWYNKVKIAEKPEILVWKRTG
jgi:hypothetical protein